MKKLSWPYIGNPEDEMGSMKGRGNYRDFMEEGYSRLDSLTPEKFTIEETASPTATISSGRRFVISNDPTESNMFFDFLFNDEDLSENSNILVASDDLESIESMASKKYNVFCLSKNSTIFSDKIICEAGDSKYFKFDKKFDAFYLEEDDLDNLKLSFLNLSDQIKNKCYGYIKSNLKYAELEAAAKYGGISLSNKYETIDANLYKIAINNLKNSMIVGVLDKDGETKAAFICDSANSFEKRTFGLQSYSTINNSFGLLFPYKRASDVSYHMGTVSYPIDIIFIDDQSCVKKIDQNIQPGDPGIFSCSGIKNVLEIKGGMSSLLDIKVGDAIFIDSAEDLSSDSLQKNTAIKKSNYLPSYTQKYGSVAIKINGSLGILKEASVPRIENVAVLDIDQFLSYDLKMHKINSYDHNNVKIIIGSSPKTISSSFEKIAAIKFASTNLPQPFCIPATSDSFSEAFTFEKKAALKDLLHFDGKIVIATSLDIDYDKVRSILNYKTKILFNKNFPEFEILRYAKNDGLSKAATNRYKDSDIYFLNKKAGMPIPKEDIEKAKQAESIFKKIKFKSEDLLKNLKKNLSVYQTVQSNKELVQNSTYEYNESVKRNTETLKSMLTDIKKALQIMNEIKDISNTFEIISAVASSTMRFSTLVKEVFDLVDNIKNDDFIPQLSQKTGELEKINLDLVNSTQRMVNYINTDILGVLVITP